jgi:PTH1 family peptidyl-tRNA hydrolase
MSIVVHDDLDILLGDYKIQLDKGPKSHNGILSINQHLGTSKYWRVRIGVEYRGESGKDMMSGEAYALEEFSKKEREILDRVFSEVVQILLN